MKKSKEEIEAILRSVENNQSTTEYYNKLEEQYKKEILEERFILEFQWIKEIDLIPLKFIKEKVEIRDIDLFEDNYVVHLFDLESLLIYMFKNKEEAQKIFPTNDLWDTNRSNSKTTKLIEFIRKEEIELCPPIVAFQNHLGIETFGIRDGNHRIALSRFLNQDKIPVIIHKDDLIRLQELGYK